jgi:ubiquinone/menaquinone biosynthesis C-methylase UbiE
LGTPLYGRERDSPVTRNVSIGEVWLGIEGAALLRSVVDGDDAFVADRIEGIRALIAQLGDGPFKLAGPVPELDIDAGYQAWAPIYDEMSNALIRAEEPLVEAALADVVPGHALDAACGTGRHAARLVAANHVTVGVDRSEAMLAKARAKLSGVGFRRGELTALPVDSASMDVVTCALALTHLADPTPAIMELARAAKPGARVVISDAHPIFVMIQGQALFPHAGGFAFVRNHVHTHGTYLRAFQQSGLEVLDCMEAPMDADFSQGIITSGAAEAAAGLWDNVPVALVWSLARR